MNDTSNAAWHTVGRLLGLAMARVIGEGTGASRFAGSADGAAEPATIWVNGQPLDERTVRALRQRHGSLRPGHCWYDAATGAWGTHGGPLAGWVQPALPLPGPLRADASGGGHGRLTGVFINGRELHPRDVRWLRQYTGEAPCPGCWWMDASGDFGALVRGQRGPVLGNVLRAAVAPDPAEQPWGLASRDGSQFVGHDGEGWFGRGSRGEAWFSP